MKNFLILRFFLAVVLSCFFITSCDDSEGEPAGKVSFIINPPENITSTNVTLTGQTIVQGNYKVEEKGLCWSTSPQPTINDLSYAFGSGPGRIVANVQDLIPATTYYVRIYAIGEDNRAKYSDQESFSTLPDITVGVNVVTNEATAITSTTSTVSGTVSGNIAVALRGICWSKDTDLPTVSHSRIANGSGTGAFSASLTGLTSNSIYYARAYAVTSNGTNYGNTISFTASTSSSTSISVVTDQAVAITNISASIGGMVTGSGIVTGRGICWSTSANPTTSNNKTSMGTGIGSFNSSLANLTASTVYYARAYAVTSSGTVYGNNISFTTTAVVTPLTVTTASITDITTTGATSGGTINGNGTVTDRGVCWSTSSNPTTNNSKTSNGTGTGTFSSSLTGLDANKLYYARAYAITSTGTIYGNNIPFTTASGTVSIVTNPIFIYQSNVSVSITLTGTAVLQSAGVCWSKTPGPTINNSKIQVAGFRGNNFTYHTISITSLVPCTKYYLRGYATNNAGVTTYGNEVEFKSPPPVLSDCHPFNGLWERANGTFIVQGSSEGFKFNYIAPTTDKAGWRNALEKGLINIGGYYITNVVPQSSNTWKCSAMWWTGDNTGGVKEVKYSQNSTIVMSSNENSFTLTSSSPFGGGPSSSTFTRKQ